MIVTLVLARTAGLLDVCKEFLAVTVTSDEFEEIPVVVTTFTVFGSEVVDTAVAGDLIAVIAE